MIYILFDKKQNHTPKSARYRDSNYNKHEFMFCESKDRGIWKRRKLLDLIYELPLIKHLEISNEI